MLQPLRGISAYPLSPPPPPSNVGMDCHWFGFSQSLVQPMHGPGPCENAREAYGCKLVGVGERRLENVEFVIQDRMKSFRATSYQIES